MKKENSVVACGDCVHYLLRAMCERGIQPKEKDRGMCNIMSVEKVKTPDPITGNSPPWKHLVCYVQNKNNDCEYYKHWISYRMDNAQRNLILRLERSKWRKLWRTIRGRRTDILKDPLEDCEILKEKS